MKENGGQDKGKKREMEQEKEKEKESIKESAKPEDVLQQRKNPYDDDGAHVLPFSLSSSNITFS